MLDKEEDPNFIMTLSIPIYGFSLQNLCFVDLGTLQPLGFGNSTMWIWELYKPGGFLSAFMSLGSSVTSHGRTGKGLMPQHQLIAKMWYKREKKGKWSLDASAGTVF